MNCLRGKAASRRGFLQKTGSLQNELLVLAGIAPTPAPGIRRSTTFIGGSKPSQNVYLHLKQQKSLLSTDAIANKSPSLEKENLRPKEPVKNYVYIALGSNLGDRVASIEEAIQLMSKRGIEVISTSSLYESMPMYVFDQEKFLNAVCYAQTFLEPIDLLNELQSIENNMGRVKIVDKGPRNIDLDILLYNNWQINHERLQVPHPGMLDREFVLRPLRQIAIKLDHDCAQDNLQVGKVDLCAPEFYTDLREAFRALHNNWNHTIYPVAHLSSSMDPLPIFKPAPTLIMAILNLTTDSFSDGGKHLKANSGHVVDKTDLLNLVDCFIRDGASIIDIGGQTSKPGAEEVPIETEIARTAPAIAIIKKHLGPLSKVAISIDTYRSDVARAAVEAGADIINDVSAGSMDEKMLQTMAQLGKTVILGHMRGTPQTMSKLTNYNADSTRVIEEELLTHITKALQAGIPRWRILVDPGFGFAKTDNQNIKLLKDLHTLTGPSSQLAEARVIGHHYREALPWVVGTSRKKFIGSVLNESSPTKRIWGNAATVALAVQAGASIVRVHDVKEMAQVAKMVDAIRMANDEAYSQKHTEKAE